MQRSLIFLAVAAIATAVSASAARAHTYGLTCHNGGDNLQGALTGTASWTSIDGGLGGSAAVGPGDVVELSGICQGDITLANNGVTDGVPVTGVTITNSLGSNTINSSDGINGQVEVRNVQLTLQGILLESGVNGDVMTNGEVANIYAHDGAAVTVLNDHVGPGPLIGIYVLRGSSAQVVSSTVDGVGTANTAKENDGIRIEANSTLVASRMVAAITVTNAAGNGISVINGSDLEFLDGSVSNNGGAQIYLNNASSAYINATGINTDGSSGSQVPLVEVFGASSLTIDANSVVSNVTGGNVPTALLLLAASSAQLNSTTLSTTGLGTPVAQASADSALILGGGNTLQATGDGGTVIGIDHASSLVHLAATKLGYPTNTAESISGRGNIQMQSSIDLGQGPDDLGFFGLVWTGNIIVQQNSSFRMQGSAHITGMVQISQQSNAFFNCNNSLSSGGSTAPNCGGGSPTSPLANVVDGGVSCPELAVPTGNLNPSAHVSNPTLVSPAPATANLFGAGSFATGSPAAGTCLNF